MQSMLQGTCMLPRFIYSIEPAVAIIFYLPVSIEAVPFLSYGGITGKRVESREKKRNGHWIFPGLGDKSQEADARIQRHIPRPSTPTTQPHLANSGTARLPIARRPHGARMADARWEWRCHRRRRRRSNRTHRLRNHTFSSDSSSTHTLHSRTHQNAPTLLRLSRARRHPAPFSASDAPSCVPANARRVFVRCGRCCPRYRLLLLREFGTHCGVRDMPGTRAYLRRWKLV
jgi:hypothetical protein